jgi:hypothetical protein
MTRGKATDYPIAFSLSPWPATAANLLAAVKAQTNGPAGVLVLVHHYVGLESRS